MDPADILRFSNGSYNGFKPVLDEKTITIRPTTSILQGIHSRVPIIVGCAHSTIFCAKTWRSDAIYRTTSNETLSGGGTSFTAALKAFFPGLTAQDLDQFNEEYAASNFASAEQQFRDATGESELRCAVGCRSFDVQDMNSPNRSIDRDIRGRVRKNEPCIHLSLQHTC